MTILYIVEENIFVVIVYRRSTEEILKHHIKDCFKMNRKQRIIMPKNGEFVKCKNYERKIKSPFKHYADFESILVSENN